jgi:hypothetical protein
MGFANSPVQSLTKSMPFVVCVFPEGGNRRSIAFSQVSSIDWLSLAVDLRQQGSRTVLQRFLSADMVS